MPLHLTEAQLNEPVTNYARAATSRLDRYAVFFQELLTHGVYVAPSQFEAIFTSAVHSDADIDFTVEAAAEAFRAAAGVE